MFAFFKTCIKLFLEEPWSVTYDSLMDLASLYTFIYYWPLCLSLLLRTMDPVSAVGLSTFALLFELFHCNRLIVLFCSCRSYCISDWSFLVERDSDLEPRDCSLSSLWLCTLFFFIYFGMNSNLSSSYMSTSGFASATRVIDGWISSSSESYFRTTYLSSIFYV